MCAVRSHNFCARFYHFHLAPRDKNIHTSSSSHHHVFVIVITLRKIVSPPTFTQHNWTSETMTMTPEDVYKLFDKLFASKVSDAGELQYRITSPVLIKHAATYLIISITKNGKPVTVIWGRLRSIIKKSTHFSRCAFQGAESEMSNSRFIVHNRPKRRPRTGRWCVPIEWERVELFQSKIP